MGLNIRTLRTTETCTNARLFADYGAAKPAFEAANAQVFNQIEALISHTNELGQLPLWQGYQRLKNYGRKIGKNASRHHPYRRHDTRHETENSRVNSTAEPH